MKKDGFTLVELLAVIIILAILYLFVMPKVTDLIKDRNKTDEYIIQNKIITAAKEYTSNYNTRFLNDFINVGYSKYISKEDLINNKLLDENEVENIGFFKVKVTLKEDNKLEYTISYDDSEKVILSVNLDGGSMISNPSGEYDVGSTITLNTPTKTDYEFSHWSIEVGNSILSGNMLTIGNTNTTIKANWIKKVTLTIDLNGGVGENKSGEYYSKTTVVLSVPTRDGYIFTGWKIVSGNAIVSGNNITFGFENVTLSAIWAQDTYEFAYTGSEQVFTAPVSGYYKLEVWGAQGGTANGYSGGYGGYSTGLVFLTKGEILYINVGGAGNSTASGVLQYVAGGYNGGGSTNGQDCCTRYFGSGGGATHIATKSGLLSTLENYKSNILIVSGGGGGSYYGTNVGTEGLQGGSGGGYIGGDGIESTVDDNKWCVGLGGNQISGGIVTTNCTQSSTVNAGTVTGSFGQGGSGDASTGGGGGYYGGSRSGHIAPAGGGSGYIGNTQLTNKVMYCYNCAASSEEVTKTITTTCTNEIATENCAKQGNGYAKITFAFSVDYDYTGSEQVFTAPASGYYKLEVWGAQGGNISNYIGGYGGYSNGTLYLKQGEILYINIGGAGSQSDSGGFNGGGNLTTEQHIYGASGGGATHIATKSGLLKTLENYRNNILIVSGGGGGANYRADGYGEGNGGSGGGNSGVNGTTVNHTNDFGYAYGKGGTQIAGGDFIWFKDNNSETDNSKKGVFGSASMNYETSIIQSGGGGGFYGGGAGNHGGAGGGSGYIGNTLLTNKVMYCYNCTASSEEATKTISTTCVNETVTENCAKKGNGYAKITYLGE